MPSEIPGEPENPKWNENPSSKGRAGFGRFDGETARE
jgi:hypothetical protein